MAQLTVWFALTAFIAGVCSSSAGGIEYLTDTTYTSSLLPLAKKGKPGRIAVVGGGIGGTASSYFLRQLFGDDVTVDLFEPETLCGRIATITIDGRQYESGGSVLHPKNVYAQEIAQAFGLHKVKKPRQKLGLFDGKKYTFETSDWWILTLLKMLWRFGLDMVKLNWLENSFMDKFLGIYDKQMHGNSFSDVRSFLLAMGQDVFVDATQESACALFSKNGIGETTINDLVSSGIRVNYGQNCEVNGFVGMVSMAGIQRGLWSIYGGNKQLCSKLFANSSVNLIKETVQSISVGNQHTFRISSGTPSETRNYDIVILAAPVNRDMSHINVSRACPDPGSCPSASADRRRFRKTVATFVKGNLNATFFHCPSRSCPGMIFTTRSDLFYRSVGLHVPVDFDSEKGDTVDNSGVYKVFSDAALTETQLNNLFTSFTEVKEKAWYGYPYYSPPEELDSFVLNQDGFYYTSPIEWAASAIEMSILSAKNSALLAFNNWYDLKDRIDPTTFNTGREDL